MYQTEIYRKTEDGELIEVKWTHRVLCVERCDE
jgi:hypothetical protein